MLAPVGCDSEEATNTAGEGSVGMLAGPTCRNEKDLQGKRLLSEKLRPSGFVAFVEFQARKLRPGETALLHVHESKRLLEDAMPILDADSQGRILFQQPLAELPDDCSRALRVIPEIKTEADAVARARLLMMVSH